MTLHTFWHISIALTQTTDQIIHFEDETYFSNF